MKTRLRWWIVVAVAVVLTARALPLAGQQAAASPDVLNALLTEVRGLRAAMEQMASAGPRVQLALGRLQLQEQRVNTMLRRLDALREQIATLERESLQQREELGRMEVAEKTEEDPNIRRAVADQARELKSMLRRAGVELQRLGAEEAEVSGTLTAEQHRWADINNRLEELERALIKR